MSSFTLILRNLPTAVSTSSISIASSIHTTYSSYLAEASSLSSKSISSIDLNSSIHGPSSKALLFPDSCKKGEQKMILTQILAQHPLNRTPDLAQSLGEPVSEFREAKRPKLLL